MSDHFEVQLEDTLFAGLASLPVMEVNEGLTPIKQLQFNGSLGRDRRGSVDGHLAFARGVLINEIKIDRKRLGNFLYILQELMKNTADHSNADSVIAFESEVTEDDVKVHFCYIEYGDGIKKSVESYLDNLETGVGGLSRKGSRHISEIYRLAFQSGFTTKRTAVNLGKGLHRIACYIRAMRIDMQVFDANSIGNISIIGPNPSHKQSRLAFSSSTANAAPFSYIGTWTLEK